jgi:hypothetical protein
MYQVIEMEEIYDMIASQSDRSVFYLEILHIFL